MAMGTEDYRTAEKRWHQDHPYGGNHPAWTGDNCPRCGNDTLIQGVKAEQCNWCDYSEGYW